MRKLPLALFPMCLSFCNIQVWKLHLKTKTILKIGVGTIYTFLGLVLFLSSANIGFMPAGYLLGGILFKNATHLVLILIGLAIGYFVVAAEPAVFVLKRQVEEVTEGVISGRAMGIGLSIGVAVFRVSHAPCSYGIIDLYFIIPGYLIALTLTFLFALFYLNRV